MSFKATAAHSSGIKKPKKKPPFKRGSSGQSPYSSLARKKPLQRFTSKHDTFDDDGFFDDRLDDVGLVKTLATDLTLRDVPQSMLYVRGKQWSQVPEQRTGMNSVRIAEVLNFRASLPPVVSVSHLQSLLNSPTTTEKEIAELIREGAMRKIVVGGRGSIGEVLIFAKDLGAMIENTTLDEELKKKFTALLHADPTALKISHAALSAEEVHALIRAGFLTSTTPSWTTTDAFSRPRDGHKGTMISINSISRAASGSLAAVGGEGAVHAAGGSGGGIKARRGNEYSLALPSMGPFLKLLTAARSHLLFILSKSTSREAPENLLRQRWDGGISADDAASEARRSRGEFTGILPGRTRKWKQFYGVSFDWVLGECVGAGLVEVFETGSVGRGVRAL